MEQKSPSPLSALGLFVWAIAAFFFLYEFFLRTFIGSVAHQIIPDLKLNAETFSILGSAYYVAYGVMQVPVGILVDKFGVKIIMAFASFTCAVATFIFAQASSFHSALIGRFLMGFGSSFAFVCLLVIAITWFPKKYFGFFAGISQFIGSMGPLLAGGPLIILMQNMHQGWRTTLEYIASIGIFITILVILFVRQKPRAQDETLVYLQNIEPLFTRLKRLIKNKQAWAVACYSASTYVPLALLGAIWGTEYLQVQGLTQKVSAEIISLCWFGYACGCPLLGALSDIAKRRRPTLIATAILGTATTITIVYIPFTHAHWAYAILFFCLGIAAAGQNVGFAAITEHISPSVKATGLGLNNGLITLSSAVLPPVVSYFIYSSAGTNATQLSTNDFFIGFAILPILYFCGIIIAWLGINETYCKPQKEVILL